MADKIVEQDGNDETINKKRELEIEVVRYLRKIGVNSCIKGYIYLKHAIIMATKDETITERITKELYPAVAKKTGSSVAGVERAIRHAVQNAWKRGNEQFLTELFGNAISKTTGRPTNREFIATVAEEIRINQFK